jgi:hypothetical protein
MLSSECERCTSEGGGDRWPQRVWHTACMSDHAAVPWFFHTFSCSYLNISLMRCIIAFLQSIKESDLDLARGSKRAGPSATEVHGGFPGLHSK